MPHEISPGPHPNIVIQRIYDELTHDDMATDDELGLDKGRLLYVLLDVSKMDVSLPDRFLDGAKNSFFVHPNLRHMALYTTSNMLASIAKMVAKLTKREGKLSIHGDYQSALNHLLKLIELER